MSKGYAHQDDPQGTGYAQHEPYPEAEKPETIYGAVDDVADVVRQLKERDRLHEAADQFYDRTKQLGRDHSQAAEGLTALVHGARTNPTATLAAYSNGLRTMPIAHQTKQDIIDGRSGPQHVRREGDTDHMDAVRRSIAQLNHDAGRNEARQQWEQRAPIMRQYEDDVPGLITNMLNVERDLFRDPDLIFNVHEGVRQNNQDRQQMLLARYEIGEAQKHFKDAHELREGARAALLDGRANTAVEAYSVAGVGCRSHAAGRPQTRERRFYPLDWP